MLKKICIVKANFNHDITDKMLQLAEKELIKKKVRYDIYEVPGAFEIPCKINQIHHKYCAFLTIGCLIKGKTMHFACISQVVANGIMMLQLELKKPVLYYILNCLNVKQAQNRINNIKQAIPYLTQIYYEN